MKQQETAYPQQQAVGASPLPSGWGKLWAAFGFGVLLYVVFFLAQLAAAVPMMLLQVDENPLLAACELLSGAMGLLLVLALGGKTIAKPRTKGMGEAWKAAAWLFAVDGVLVVVDIVQVATGEHSIDVAADWPFRMMVLVLLCLGVGLFEETLIRGLCLNGLLARMGTTVKGVIGAAVISSLMFGMLHFDFFIDFGDPLQVAQNSFKVLQTGIVGYVSAAILVKTRNLWTVVVIHAANDLMLMFMTYGLTDETLTTEYVSTGEEGMAVLLVYIVLCLLYMPLVIIGTRMIRAVGPWRGDFYHYGEQAAPTAVPVAQPVTQPVPYGYVYPYQPEYRPVQAPEHQPEGTQNGPGF